MSFRVSRIELRSCSGVPAVRPVKIPSPPAFETAATSLGRPTHLREQRVSCQLEVNGREVGTHIMPPCTTGMRMPSFWVRTVSMALHVGRRRGAVSSRSGRLDGVAHGLKHLRE